ncbi:hypothetical protein ZTR_11131 [Talaromyces verruculosus]|nr:hypothetical protein ZTR_11131 [Talaromyces verruculosus]
MDLTDLSPTSGEEPAFCIAPDLLWRHDPSRAVVTWTPDSFSPPISLVLDPWLRGIVMQYEKQMAAYVLGEDCSQLPAISIPPRITAYHSHDLLASLKRMLGPPHGPDLNGIAETIADLTTSVRAFYHLLTATRLLRRHVHAYDKTLLEILLSLALYRPVYFWSPHELPQWQPWTLVDYAITAEETTAILMVTNDTAPRQHVYDLQSPVNDCTIAFEPY